ncbi:MAG: hypothetical protein FXF49_11780 [Flexistipes sinusarabici]|uniref:Uncharacterized protein n=1 Tax=Flexistipes sinusarabici TaxID=2352 RepID=A0A5D0MLN5_FLESI|nr:hypothetical protein [Flexistipes sinusarabici]TYB32381.1 MAG: hypothetical protein FXF49_11780 [Flexistipes sinusarabici]
MIKNFIYLDEEKMYSLSSQLFKGVTEYVLNESSSEKGESEEQKGPVGSGRILGDILKNSERNTEKKFLNDYSYTIFEEKLLEDDMVLIVSGDKFEGSKLSTDKSFIKITSKATFNDINSINKTLKNFNKIGKALAHITNFQEISEVREQLEKAKQNTKDRNQKSKLQTQLKSMTNINKLATESGLQQDQSFLDDLSLVLTYGFQDQLEVQMDLVKSIFSANLNRSFLREPEELVIRKYSRKTEVEFTLFGIITQHQREKLEELEEYEEYDSIKEALMNLVSHLSNVEATFTGRLSNEIIIDPIALYTEL